MTIWTFLDNHYWSIWWLFIYFGLVAVLVANELSPYASDDGDDDDDDKQ
jgi:hypothetical protein